MRPTTRHQQTRRSEWACVRRLSSVAATFRSACSRPKAAAAALAAGIVLLPLTATKGTAQGTAPTYTVLYSFTAGNFNNNSVSGLIQDAAGNLYGTTDGGGNVFSCGGFGCGVVFKLDPSGNETVLYSFTGGADGAIPEAGLIRDAAGNLYGTTSEGGNTSGSCAGYGGCGVVFKLDAAGNETVLYTFTGGADGLWPYAGLIRDAAGNLYGTTVFGGTYGAGSGLQAGPVRKRDCAVHLHRRGGRRVSLRRLDPGRSRQPLRHDLMRAAIRAARVSLAMDVEWSSSWTRQETRPCFTPSPAGRTGRVPTRAWSGTAPVTFTARPSTGGTISFCMPTRCGVVFKVDPAETRQCCTALRAVRTVGFPLPA